MHTPGEWKVRFVHSSNVDDGECDFFVQAPKVDPKMGYDIEIMQDDFGDGTGYPRKQKLADARLIAAAPDLLKALLVAVNQLRMMSIAASEEGNESSDWAAYNSSREMQQIRAALDKVTAHE